MSFDLCERWEGTIATYVMSPVDYRVRACRLFGGCSGAKSSSSPAGKGIGVGGWANNMACSANLLWGVC